VARCDGWLHVLLCVRTHASITHERLQYDTSQGCLSGRHLLGCGDDGLGAVDEKQPLLLPTPFFMASAAEE